MRASVLREGRMVLRDDVAEPVPGPGQVLVEVKACGICGSDLHFAKHGDQMVKLTREMKGMPVEGGLPVDLADDVFMGHEFSAEVLEAGPDTEAPSPGTVVTSLPVLLSPKGFEPILSSNTTIGGYAERMLLSAPLLLRIPNGLDPRHASLTEPMAVGLHAVNKSSIQPGEAALVIGCGPIGLADHRRAAPPRRGTHCGCRLFAEATRVGDDDGRPPDGGSGRWITVRPRQAGSRVRGRWRSRNRQ